MQTKYKILITISALVVTYAFGRYSAPEKVRIETKIVYQETKKEDEDKSISKNKHSKKTVIVVTRPDGTKEEKTVIVEDSGSNLNKSTSKTDELLKSETMIKEVEKSKSRLTISALVGSQLSLSKQLTPVYGGHITRDVIGPINLGVFGFSSGLAGFSLGLSF